MPKILIVDDSAVDRRLVTSLLVHQPQWSVDSAGDGQAAIEQLSAAQFDLVITDLQMPRMDGLALVRAVRRHHGGLPVVLITSHGSEEIALEALRVGAVSYSPKSRLRQDLVPTVRHVLELSAAARRPGPPPETGGQTNFHYVIGNDVSFVGPLVEHLENNLPAWTDPDRLRISMALSEALINAIHHGNLEVDSHLRDDDEAAFFDAIRRRRSTRPYAARRVRIEAEFTGDEVRFCITDEGRGFDHSQVGDPTQADKLLGVGGRGLLLIRSLMDETQHNPQGNQITLVKRRGRRSPAVHPD